MVSSRSLRSAYRKILVALTVLSSASCGGAQGSSHARHGDASKLAPDSGHQPRSWPLAIQVGHSSDVYSAAFSPDGSLVATGDHTGTIEIWDPATGEVHAELVGHTANVTSLAFSSDGNRLASGGEDGRAFVWDLTRGTRLSQVEIPNRKVWAVALTPRGDVLVLRDNIGMTLYRAEDGHEVGSYEHSNVPSAVLSPDGSLVAVGTGSNIEIVSVKSDKKTAVLAVDQPVRQVIFSSDGRSVVTAGGDTHNVTIFDVASGAKKREIATSGRVVAVAMDGKSTMVAAAIDNQGVEIFDVQTGSPISTIDAKHTTEWHFGMTADGRRVFASDAAGSVQTFDTRSGKAIAKTAVDGLRRFVLDASHGRVAALRDHDPTVDIWDGSHVTASLVGAPERVRWAGLMPDGRSLAIVEDDSPDVVLFDLAKASISATFQTSLGHVYEAIPSPDGARLVATGYGESLILDAKTGVEQKRFGEKDWSSQHQAAWSAKGDLALVGANDHTLFRFNKKLEPLPPLDVGAPIPTALRYSPDGSILAMAGPAGVVVIDHSDRILPISAPLRDPAFGLAWSPDGKRVAVATERSLFTITLPSLDPSARGEGMPPPITTELDTSHAFVATAFSKDGDHIAGSERTGVIDFFTEDHSEKSFHTHGTPWSISFLASAHAPVAIVAAGSLVWFESMTGPRSDSVDSWSLENRWVS